jgi:hypothetical protein
LHFQALDDFAWLPISATFAFVCSLSDLVIR